MTFKVLEMGNGTTKTGKSFKRLKIEGEDGNHKVNLFSDWPDYANVSIGSTIEGTIEQNGQYENIRSATQTARAGGAYKQKVIEESMQRKEASIGKFQDNKEWSIMTASSMTNAVNLAIAEYKDKNVLDTLDQAVLKWRRFIIENWELDPKDYPPF